MSQQPSAHDLSNYQVIAVFHSIFSIGIFYIAFNVYRSEISVASIALLGLFLYLLFIVVEFTAFPLSRMWDIDPKEPWYKKLFGVSLVYTAYLLLGYGFFCLTCIAT